MCPSRYWRCVAFLILSILSCSIRRRSVSMSSYQRNTWILLWLSHSILLYVPFSLGDIRHLLTSTFPVPATLCELASTDTPMIISTTAIPPLSLPTILSLCYLDPTSRFDFVLDAYRPVLVPSVSLGSLSFSHSRLSLGNALYTSIIVFQLTTMYYTEYQWLFLRKSTWSKWSVFAVCRVRNFLTGVEIA